MELLIGRVMKAHGIRGEVSVDVTTDEPEIRFAIGEVLHGKQGKLVHELTIKTVRAHKGRLLITFEEIPDRNGAESLRGTRFFAEPLEAADDDEGFYDHELEGLRVLHNGEDIGVVIGVMHTAAQSLLEVKMWEKDVLIPFVEEIVPEVDLEAGMCAITPPEGLLEL